MIEVQNLTKRYGSQYAVRNISFRVEEGEIVGFLGPNGAGKSTTMNILTGYLSATEGVVKVNGHDVLEEPNEAKANIGYLPEQPPLYLDMTVREYLAFMYDLKKCKLDREKAHRGDLPSGENRKRIWTADQKPIQRLPAACGTGPGPHRQSAGPDPR